LGSHILLIRAVVDDGPAWAIAGRSIRGAAFGLSGGVIGIGLVGDGCPLLCAISGDNFPGASERFLRSSVVLFHRLRRRGHGVQKARRFCGQ
jgi:hypothetical protein